MAKVMAICGKICCGKTYYSNTIKEKEKAIVLSCDEVTSMLFDNNLGNKHDEVVENIKQYLLKKSIEAINAGCSVILDWGFWSKQDRASIKDYYKSKNIACEMHYIDITDTAWNKNIEERNNRILQGNGGNDYYLDEGLKNKLLSKWEEPSKDEIDVWYNLDR